MIGLGRLWCRLNLFFFNDRSISNNVRIIYSRFSSFIFRYNWSPDKEDKDTLTDPCEWKDEAFCSCSDIEGGCTGKCVKCSPDHQIPSDVLNQCVNSVCVQKSKDRKRKKRQRFSFLQKNIQDKKKEKDQENQDMKCVRRKNIDTIKCKIEQGASRIFHTNNSISS